MEDKELLKQYMLFAGVNASQLAEEIEVSKQYILNLIFYVSKLTTL